MKPRAGISACLGVLALIAGATEARADVHTVRINEYFTQCATGSTDAQYIELKPYFINQFFRQCTSLSIQRTVGGTHTFFAKPVFVGHGNGETYTTTQTFLLATPSFQTSTGIVPDLLIPDGVLDPAGGVIRLAADSGCEPNTNWGTIHEVRYGDQGADPAPGPDQAANFRSSTATFLLGTPTPRNFAGATTSTVPCAQTGAPLPEGVSRPVVLQNSPNPFTPETSIGFVLPAPARVRIDIYSIGGALVRALHDGEHPAGPARVLWNGADDQGRPLPAGVYFYVFESGAVREVNRMILRR